MTIARVLSAALLAGTLTGTVALADPLKGKQPVASESVTPTANGPKPYHASLSGECGPGACLHNFGKKGNKVRKIKIVTCGMITPTEKGTYAMIYLDSASQYIIPVGSSVTVGTIDYAMFEFQYGFTVPEGQVLGVYFFSGGTPTSSLCTVDGTIE